MNRDAAVMYVSGLVMGIYVGYFLFYRPSFIVVAAPIAKTDSIRNEDKAE